MRTNLSRKKEKKMGGIYFLFQGLSTMRTHYLLILLLVFTTPLLVLVLSQLRRKINEGRTGKWRLPPGPNRLPLIGNLHQLGDLPHLSLQKLSYEYGPLMFLQLGSIPTLVVSSADMAKEIFRTHDLLFSGRPVLYAAKKLSYGCVDITFSPYGEYWREVKKITILELLSARRVRSFRAVREEEVASAIDFVRKSSSSVPINLSEMMLCLVNDVICRAAFGRKYEDGRSNGRSIFHTVLQETQDLLAGFCTADFFPWMGWIHKFDGLEARLEKNFRQLDNFYDKVIDEHLNPQSQRQNPELEDLVDVLLRIQGDPSQGITLSGDQIKGILTDLFIAGSDTSAATLVWTMTELIRNPTVMKRAEEDVRRNIGNKEVVEESDLPKLSYLKLVIKEAMRLHPPAPLPAPRETTENCTIKGYKIPAKTRVFFNVKAIAMDPKYWENPEEFRPERFLDNNIEFNGQDFELIPFGAGRRGCPGINFAVVLIELVLANLLHCFDWELPPGMKREEVDMKEASGLTMHKKFPLCLVADTVNVNKIG